MRDYLKNLREDNKLTHSKIAEELNMSRSNYSNIENGERQKDMSLSTVKKLAAVFGVPVEQIMELETEYRQARDESEAV